MRQPACVNPMSFDDLFKLAVTFGLAQTFALVIGLFLFRYLNAYIGTKAENRATIEDSPVLIAIQKRLDEISSISADIGKEKLDAYLAVGSQFAADSVRL